MGNSLEIRDLVCGYNHFKLDDICFDVHKGAVTGIIGPNGSGKTTLIKGILGELKLIKGSMKLDGKDIREMSINERATKMAVVTQNIGNSDLSVFDYVLLGRMPYRKPFQFFETSEDINIALKYINLTGIGYMKEKSISQLSGGERQLASIAKALAQEPSLLLLDEPTSALDINHQVRILDLVRQLNHDMNLTVLMIIHDLNLASEYCDHLLMMNRGRIHVQGTPEEVIHYREIEDVYQTCVVTLENPVSGKPNVFLISGNAMQKVKK
jgi:iron complex transport system ATP-binding protein